MNGNPRERDSAMHRAVDGLERSIENGQASVAIAVGIGLILIQIPGIQDVAEKIGLDSSRELLIAVGALLLTSILLELRQLKRKVSPVITGRQHYSDQNEMYNALREKAGRLTDPEQFKLDVLGLTLFSAWPQIESFLEDPRGDSWTVRLATLAEKGTAALPWVPDNWPKESAATVAQVEVFRSQGGSDHRHTIEIYEYDLVPAVHGFRLGNGDVFVSTLRWRDKGRLGKHRFPYEYVPAYDVSPEADAARALFRSWFERAMLSATEFQRVNSDEDKDELEQDQTTS